MRIILLCAQGMSTSLLVNRMSKEASDQGIEAEIQAHTMDSFEEIINTADVILLGPQIRYKKSEFFKKAGEAGVPIDIVDMKAYGMMNGKKVLSQALKLSSGT